VSLRVALAQATCTPGDLRANVEAAARTIAQAADRGARLVVFPELALAGYDLPLLAARADAWLASADDPRLDPVRRACETRHVTAVLGAATRAGGEATLCAPIVGADGRVALSHKEYVHGSEKDLFAPGEARPPFEVDGWRVAVGICFDAAHPAHAAKAAAARADLYVVSALYVVGEERRLDLHLGARAMDFRMFSAVANWAGTIGGHASCGQSAVWRPTGDVLCRAGGAAEELVVADLDRAELAPFRA
jgi:predicted amidohydrolase